MTDALLTVDEVARELRVSPRKIYLFIQSGELKATNVGTTGRKIFRISRSDFDTFLQTRRQSGPRLPA